jgi:hypothetical protein
LAQRRKGRSARAPGISAIKRGKSKLSKVTIVQPSSSTCTSGNNSDDDLSSLDDLAGILDEAIE